MAQANHLDIESPSTSFCIEYLYPFPISDQFKRYQISVSPTDKLGYMVSTIETSLRLLTSIGLTIYKTKKSNLLLTDINFSTPTMGTWGLLCGRLLPLIYNEFGNKIELVSFMSNAQKIIAMRNNFAHGSAISEDSALSLFEENKLPFLAALGCLNFFKDYLLIVPERMELTRNPNGFNTVVRICRGCNSHFQFEMWNTKAPLFPNVPILISLQTLNAYTLMPIIRTVKNKNSGANNFYFYSRKNREDLCSWQTFEYYKENIVYNDGDLSLEISNLFDNTSAFNDRYSDYLNKIEFNSTPSFFNFALQNDLKTWFELPHEYSLIGKIGEGRFSEVYKIKHNSLGEIRVLKIPKRNFISDYKITTRFDTEAKILSKLRDTKTSIRLHEYNKTKDGYPYLIEEFAPIGTLEEYSNRMGELSWQETVEIGIDTFRKLQTIHKNGILHRDIKLSNILIDSNDYRLFCDFGVSKMAELERNITTEGDQIGTYIFMPPEQKEGKSEPRSDVFSLGVCLIALLAAEYPTSPRNWVYENSKSLPKEFAQLLLSLVEPIPENRPQNINAILQILGVLRKKASTLTVDNIELLNGEQSEIKKISKPKKEVVIWTSPNKTEFRLIDNGQYIMGGTKYPDERPVHKVVITEPFFMATAPVTNSQFSEFINSTKYNGRNNSFLLHLRRKNIFSEEWRNPDAPVVFVSWLDAKEYVLWRSEKDNKDYHLPSEAEWEYACRAGNRYVYNWGNVYDKIKMNVGNIVGHPTPVGSYAPNDWGLYDMLGNVWEWCEDFFDVRPEEESIFYKYCSDNFSNGINNPVNSGQNPIISKKAKPGCRTGRGGSWFSESHNCRPANRRGEQEDKCLRSFGFRLVAKNIKNEETKSITLD